LAKDIETNQKLISSLNDEAAPIRAEVRKVEAEVGPIKYIAAFVYGQTDTTVLEKAVTWVIIILIVVFDPLAVILLLSSQISFQNFRERNRWDFERDLEEATDAFNDVFADELANTDKTPEEIMGYVPDPYVPDPYVADVGEKPTAEERAEIELNYPYEPVQAKEVKEVIPEAVVEEKEPVRTVITGNRPVRKTRIFKTPPQTLTTVTEDLVQEQLEADNHHTVTHMGNGYVQVDGQMYHEGSVPPHIQGYIQNEEQRESGQWSKVKKDEE
jgi:hypothetical protein